MHTRQCPRSLDRATSIFPQPGGPLPSPPWALARRSGLAPDRPPLRPSPEREPASSSLSSEPQPPLPCVGDMHSVGGSAQLGLGQLACLCVESLPGPRGQPGCRKSGFAPHPQLCPALCPSDELDSLLLLAPVSPSAALQPCTRGPESRGSRGSPDPAGDGKRSHVLRGSASREWAGLTTPLPRENR